MIKLIRAVAAKTSRNVRKSPYSSWRTRSIMAALGIGLAVRLLPSLRRLAIYALRPCLSWPARLDNDCRFGLFQALPRSRRGGRAVECTALEMRHTGNRIGGSNPSLSATLQA